jgi:hypothetical protein
MRQRRLLQGRRQDGGVNGDCPSIAIDWAITFEILAALLPSIFPRLCMPFRRRSP